MRIRKWLAPTLLSVAFVAGAAAAAVAEGLCEFKAFYCSSSNPLTRIMCVEAGPDIVGRPCTVLANGTLPVGVTVLLVGKNYVVVPQMGPIPYEATAPGVEGKWFVPGSN
jgi:hypothetical protein